MRLIGLGDLGQFECALGQFEKKKAVHRHTSQTWGQHRQASPLLCQVTAAATEAAVDFPMPKVVDYSKWADIDVSDDDEDGPANAKAAKDAKAAARAEAQRQAEVSQRQAEAAGLRSAIDAAAMASSVGDYQMLDQMMAQAQASAPLAPEMEAVLSTLPEAARIAARASASLQTAAGPAASGAKEPTLAELLKAQGISLDADDPGLESVEEFFETADSAAASEKKLQEAQERARAAAAAGTKPTGPSHLDSKAIEWEGQWS